MCYVSGLIVKRKKSWYEHMNNMKYKHIALSRFTNSGITFDASSILSSNVKKNVKHPLEPLEVLYVPRCQRVGLLPELNVSKKGSIRFDKSAQP